MKRKKAGQEKADIFGSIRKPTAPPSQKMGSEKREAKADPVHRKAKHKKRPEESDR